MCKPPELQNLTHSSPDGGHCRPDSYRGFTEYEELFGREQALKILDNEFETLNLVEKLIKETGASCDFWRGQSDNFESSR
jgi:hypothetical protein